jgi:threonyl-tRNA synthetase
MGAKIRRARLDLIPVMAVIGQREAEAGTISVRSRKHGEEGLMTTPDFIIRLQTEIRNYGG